VSSSRMRGVILPLPQAAMIAWSLIEEGRIWPFRYEKCYEPNISASRHCKPCPTDDLSYRWSWREGGNLREWASKQDVNQVH
jgi:hypothetical protein